MDVLNILGNEKRRAMLKILAHRSMHISALAREVGISVPVALKHVRHLESADLIQRRACGGTTMLEIRNETIDLLKRLDDIIEKPTEIHARKGETLYTVLKRLDGYEIRKVHGTDEYFITGIDGVNGFYIFQVDGKMADVGVKEFVIKEDMVIEFQKLIPVLGKRLAIQIER